jgi:FkbH-like protein
VNSPHQTTHQELKALLVAKSPRFFTELVARTRQTTEFDELIFLGTLRKKAEKSTLMPDAGDPLRIAFLSGYSLYPLHETTTHLLIAEGIRPEVFVGEYDNYVSEIFDAQSGLYRFKPDVVFLLPSGERCKYLGALTDDREKQLAAAKAASRELIDLATTLHERCGAEVLLANFVLPAYFDLGNYRSRTLGSEWSFKKYVNLELGLDAPPFLHICDLEFLANRRGALACRDDKAWFETKQPCSPAMLVDLSREIAHIVSMLRRPQKKVLVLDLDNTLWGGVIGDDGIEGIEIGSNSARGESFKAFQGCVQSLKSRGVLLAVCSKNDRGAALAPFETHPEIVLKLDDFVCFKANWQPKSENIREIAAELNLGLESLVFVDDNPAEIELVNQFLPEVATILLDSDPANYVRQLQDSRFFEPRQVTREDALRTGQYRFEAGRKELEARAPDMDAYLASLEMVGSIAEFRPADIPRIAQLVNKSNQFNVTTRRRTEAEVEKLMRDPDYVTFSIRLADKFGDHGLIAVLIAKIARPVLEIDTWLMSCRVLNRQVEEETRNELVRLARLTGCTEIMGIFVPSAKNAMVSDLFPRMGFKPAEMKPDICLFKAAIAELPNAKTHIEVTRRSYESGGDNLKAAGAV